MSGAGLSGGQRLRQALRSSANRLRGLAGRRRWEEETDEELRFHLEMAIAERVAGGMDPVAARRAARHELGGLEQVREACRDQRGVPWLETSVRDLRWSARTLARTPAFTVTAVAILALGIGALAVVAPVVEAVLLEPLAFPHPERLVALWESWPEWGWERANTAPANLLDWREQVPALARVSGHGFVNGWALGGAGAPERVTGIQVLDGYFAVFGRPLAVGREIAPAEAWSGGERVAVIGHGLWQRRFAGDPGVVGRTIDLDGESTTVVGVAPEGFDYPQPGIDLFVPFRFSPSAREQAWFRRSHFVRGVGRLAPGATLDRARQQLAAVADRLQRRFPETNEGKGAGMTPLRDWLVGDATRPLGALAVAAVLLLLVACANVAGLLLARAASRGRELAVRSALGAGRGRLIRQLVTENLLLAAAGGGLGALIGILGLPLLVELAGDALPRAHQIHPRLGALLGGLGATLATLLLFAIAPSLRAARALPSAALRGSGRAHTGGPDVARGRGLLVAAEVALATVLVSGAGLALRSYAAITAVQPGFRPTGVLAVSYSLPPAHFPQPADVLAFHRRAVARAAALPGVASAALASSLPLEDDQWTSELVVEGGTPTPAAGETPELNRRIVSPGYFRTLGVRLLEGRGFRPGAGERTAAEVVVNRTLARRHFPDRSPLGQRVDWVAGGERAWRTIVGVSADERIQGLGQPAPAEVLVPTGQEALEGTGYVNRSTTLVVRGAGDEAEALLPELRRAFAELDPRIPLYDPRTLSGMLAESTRSERLVAVLLGTFAAVALALALLGLYGLVAYTVAERRREIGIRLALGASPGGAVGRLTLATLGFVAGGLAVGLAVATVAGRALDGFLHGIASGDPPTLAATGGLLLLAAALAAALPARAATRVDPMETLRAE